MHTPEDIEVIAFGIFLILCCVGLLLCSFGIRHFLKESEECWSNSKGWNTPGPIDSDMDSMLDAFGDEIEQAAREREVDETEDGQPKGADKTFSVSSFSVTTL